MIEADIYKNHEDTGRIKMSELEKDNLINSIKGLQPEQKVLVIQTFPDELLWAELRRRYDEVITLGNKMRELVN